MTKYITFLLGAVMFVAGWYVVLRDVHVAGTSHAVNAIFGGLAIFFGLMFLVPTVSMKIAQDVIKIIGPYLPEIRVGGRRKTDPPAEE